MIQGGQTYSYHFDALGNTLAMSDASQSLVNAYAYSPYGRIVNQQEIIPQPFTYVGQAGVMTEAGTFYYMRARYYDAEVGRFISEDPIGFEGGLNLYAYVGGNPINAVDPSGLWSFALEGYFGVGGGINVASESGTLEVLGRFGVGLGGGVSFDPNGVPSDHSLTSGSGAIARASGQAGVALGVGPFGVGVSGIVAAGNAFTHDVGGGFTNGSASTFSSDGKWEFGIKAGGSVGVDFGGYTNFKRGGSSCLPKCH